MKLTKEQDKLATRLRDAGIPGDFAVLAASLDNITDDKTKHYPSTAIVSGFSWHKSPEGVSFWSSFNEAWRAECNARGIK